MTDKIKFPYHMAGPIAREAADAHAEHLAAAAEHRQPKREPFYAADYIRVKREPNLDALRTLDPEILARLKVAVVTKTNFKSEPAHIDLGEAVKETAETKDAA